MRALSVLLAIGAIALASGCSDSAGPADANEPAASADSAQVKQPLPAVAPALDGHELERAINDPLDRARAVEGDLLKAAEEKDERLQEDGG